MTVLFLGYEEDDDVWMREILAADPEIDLATPGAIRDPASVEYAIVGRTRPGDLAAYPRLKAILSMWAGVEHLLADETVPAHVPIVRMVEPSLTRGMVEYVCGHTLGVLLRVDAYPSAGAWGHPQKTAPRFAPDFPVGILGLGVLGRACGDALRSLGFPVNGWSREAKRADGIDTYAGPSGLGDCLSQSRLVVLLLPNTPATRSVLGREALARLPAGAAVINAGRGELIDDDALLDALDSGHLSRAILDVFREEPLPASHPFWSHPRVTVTPHLASVTNPRTAAPVLADNLSRLKRGEAVVPLVDRRRGY